MRMAVGLQNSGMNAMDVALKGKEWDAVELLMEWNVPATTAATSPAKIMGWPLERFSADIASRYLFGMISTQVSVMPWPLPNTVGYLQGCSGHTWPNGQL